MPDEIYENMNNYGKENVGKRGKAMLEETKLILDEFFKPYNEKLAKLLGDNKYLWNEIDK